MLSVRDDAQAAIAIEEAAVLSTLKITANDCGGRPMNKNSGNSTFSLKGVRDLVVDEIRMMGLEHSKKKKEKDDRLKHLITTTRSAASTPSRVVTFAESRP